MHLKPDTPHGPYVSLLDLVGCLSRAMDLISPAVGNHHARVGYIAAALAATLGLDQDLRGDLLLAGLLHDSGALSLKSRLDALQFEADGKVHAEMGYRLLRASTRLARPAAFIRRHHATARMVRAAGDIPMEANLLCLADRIDVLIARDAPIGPQVAAICERIRRSGPEVFDAAYLDAFVTLAEDQEFWEGAAAPLGNLLRYAPEVLQAETLDHAGILEFSALFSQIIDFRSPFTATHSHGVAVVASCLAKALGFPASECELMHVAGNLHDLGKLAVPAELIEKPAPLTAEEYEIVKKHALHSYEILSDLKGLAPIVTWAALHHERLDGAGYPFGYAESEISTGARILAVADVFTAVAEDRPYRRGMAKDEVIEILREMAEGDKLDADVVRLLLEHFDEVNAERIRGQKHARLAFEGFYKK